MKYKSIVITGASTGLGRQLALEFAKTGGTLHLIARSKDALNQLVSEIENQGGKSFAYPIDITQTDEFVALLKSIDEKDPVDLAIANAGWAGKLSYPSETNIDVAKTIADLNFKAAIITLETLAKGMVERKRGHLVGVSSVAGFRGLPGSAIYSASKAGFTTYLEALRFSTKPRRVYVTDIRPGFVYTPLTAKNNHPMPFIISVQYAGHLMFNAIIQRKRRFTFPWQMAIVGAIMRNLPYFVWDWVGEQFRERAVCFRRELA